MARALEKMTEAELREEVRTLRRQLASDVELRALIQNLSVHQEEVHEQNKALAEAQRALEASNDRYAALFDFAPVGYVSLDSNGVIQDINLTAAQLIGSERSRLQGLPFVVCVAEPDRRIFLDHVARCRRGEPLVRSELRLKPRDREVVEVEFTSKRLVDAQREFFYGVLVDVTERRRSERERLAAEIEYQRVLQESEAARASNEAKDQFLAALSHELRTPLAPIPVAIADLEQRGMLPESASETLAMIRRNVELEARLIDDLLDVTRIARGKLAIEPEEVDLHELLTDTATLCRAGLDGGRHTFSMDLRATRRRVRGDPTRLRQVFWNVLENSIRHTPRGGEVGLRSEDAGEGRVRVVVTDTGPGIPPEDLERIFLPFEQGRERSAGGLGLGLAISKGLVDAHGGTIRATLLAPHGGAQFEVELPADSGPARPAVRAVRAKVPAASPLRLLLVEDHLDTANALAAYLRGRGYDVLLAHSFAEASKIPPADFHVLITDLQLPDGSGLELIEEMRNRKPVKAIAMSGFGSEADRRRSLEAGFARHLTKPVDVRAILEAIEGLARS